MGKHPKTVTLIAEAIDILQDYNPQTVRQVYYQLVSRQVIENVRTAYQKVSTELVELRKRGIIPWDWIEDRLRLPRAVSMWDDLADFAYTAEAAYRRDVWATQPGYVECWLEKDALSGVFDIIREYGVTLQVGRGYDGWDSIRNAAERYAQRESVEILYFGDQDPSGDDMVRSLRERLEFFGCRAEITKCALTLGDVARYNLPPNPTKTTDTRRTGYVAKNGDISVELDALPVKVLQTRIREEIEKRMDMSALRELRSQEVRERETLVRLLNASA